MHTFELSLSLLEILNIAFSELAIARALTLNLRLHQ